MNLDAISDPDGSIQQMDAADAADHQLDQAAPTRRRPLRSATPPIS